MRIELPQPTPTVVTELQAAFRDPNPDLDHIAELIAIEPALSAEVLRRSNSVKFGGTSPATDVYEAISRIGMYETYSALLALNDPPRTIVAANVRSALRR